MLEKPEHGWSTITLGEWSDRCSYVDDVPYMLLDAVLSVLRTWRPAVVEFDAEGYGYVVGFTTYYTFSVSDRGEEKKEFSAVDRDIESLAAELCKDIKSNIDDWASWMDDEQYVVEDRKKDLLLACETIEKLISDRGVVD